MRSIKAFTALALLASVPTAQAGIATQGFAAVTAVTQRARSLARGLTAE